MLGAQTPLLRRQSSEEQVTYSLCAVWLGGSQGCFEGACQFGAHFLLQVIPGFCGENPSL